MSLGKAVIRRKFQLTDLKGNSNKSWMVEFYDDGSLVTTWGRVGHQPQSKTKPGHDIHAVERLIKGKLRKGYIEVDLHRAQLSADPVDGDGKAIDKRVQQLAEFVQRESNLYIDSYLAIGVEALSQAQIDKGRELLQQAQAHHAKGKRKRKQLAENVQQYYNTIPSYLPARIDIDEVVSQFVADFHEQEERLDQIEAALASYEVEKSDEPPSLRDLIGAEIAPLEQNTKAYGQIADYVLRTANDSRLKRWAFGGDVRRIHEIFSVEIPPERAQWNKDGAQMKNISSLFHGTWSRNLRHILRTGLIIPRHAVNGSRFGRGIYFADKARRSLNYCQSMTSDWRVLFVADVALGKARKTDGAEMGLNGAPEGYDSIHGGGAFSGMDEFVVYRASQQTIRALVLVE